MSTRPGSDGRFALTVNDSQDFVKVATSGGRVRDSQTDDFLGVDDEHCSDGEGNTLGIDVGSILVVQHLVQGCDRTVLVGDLEGWDQYPLAKNVQGPRLTMG